MPKVLAVGSGGREAAMVLRLAQSPGTTVYCAPGNPGIGEQAICVPTIGAMDITKLLTFAVDESIDLTVVGPEGPLAAGIVDRFREKGKLICGPTAAAAQAEASKAWFKRLLQKYDIPTAPFKVFDENHKAFAYIE